MAGLVPAIHVRRSGQLETCLQRPSVDARLKAGHDGTQRADPFHPARNLH